MSDCACVTAVTRFSESLRRIFPGFFIVLAIGPASLFFGFPPWPTLLVTTLVGIYGVFVSSLTTPRTVAISGDQIRCLMWSGREVELTASSTVLYRDEHSFQRHFVGWILIDSEKTVIYLPPDPINFSAWLDEAEAQGLRLVEHLPEARMRGRKGVTTALRSLRRKG